MKHGVYLLFPKFDERIFSQYLRRRIRIEMRELRAESAKHTSPGRNPGGFDGHKVFQALKGRDIRLRSLYVAPFQGSPKSVTIRDIFGCPIWE